MNTITVTLELDVTGLSEDEVTKVREGVAHNADYVAKSWRQGARDRREERERLERERAARPDAANQLRDEFFDGRRWVIPHAGADLASDAWYHSGAENTWHISSVRVEEGHQRQGHGRRLMEILLQYADLCGQNTELRVFPDNTAAVALYESLGYVIDESASDWWETSEQGAYLNARLMRRPARALVAA